MLQVKNIHKQYKTGALVQKALDGVSLNLRDNEFVAILGPSGSGKTTLLNIIGGLDRYDKGDLIINGISTKKYKDRDWDSYRNHTIGFVFQSYNLIPHQTILSNVELALTISGVSKSERRKRAQEALNQVGLGDQVHKKPNQLSGGQMQRVAIARALVNDPDILLADEPTGALDSDTSVQVMDLLKAVAKDRLVVMVTHNPDLAQEYATRIVTLKDGKITSDSDPYKIEQSLVKPVHKNMGKTGMSLLTSLSLSFNNLNTKKARTILTSFAGSIGIIGIALILSLSTGVNAYIADVEEETMSEYPISITSTGFDMTSLVSGMTGIAENVRSGSEEDEIQVNSIISTMSSTIGSNDLEALKEYIDSGESGLEEYSKAIEYIYDVTPQIYSSDTSTIHQVNPDSSFSALGIGSSTSSSSLLSSMMSTDVFYQMPENTSLYDEQYDVVAGSWPTSYNECVLVLSSGGSISDFLLYTLGLRDYSELQDMLEQFSNDEEVTVTTTNGTYSYDDILGITFKLINATDYYQYDEEYNVWKDKSGDEDYMKDIIDNGEDLTIVGIVLPKEDVTATMLSSGFYYTSELIEYIVEQAINSDIVKQQLANPDINVFTGESFDAEEESSFDFSSMFSIDSDALSNAFQFDESALSIDLSGLNSVMTQVDLPELDMSDIISQLDFSLSSDDMTELMNELVEGYASYASSSDSNINTFTEDIQSYFTSTEVNQLLQELIQDAISENGELTITNEQMESILNELMASYGEYATENNLSDTSDLTSYITDYLNSDTASTIITNYLTDWITSSGLEDQLTAIMTNYMSSVMSFMSTALQQELTSSLSSLSSSMANAISIDTDAFANAFQMNMDEDDMTELLTTLMTSTTSTYENNLSTLGYVDYASPTEIDIYPMDFESKEEVINILDAYNDRMEANGEEDKVISYTDLVGTLMSSVTDIINTLSYVLMAFVAISLVVSSIMIGVITYISVLERKKEIGILRAMGASKSNISQVFNAETFIIGLLAGVLGIVISLLLLIPGNYIIHTVAGNTSVNAQLPVTGAIVLIVLSTVLTLIGGLIPSRKAAKEDPVTALRTE
ncbi:MAG: ABC transporter ATP-binding protein/permease [Erysipelotrichaceae bacterium]|nr:ABC transporter ATP-binding protein/permease [Erysipelotrichaceae bacterium]